MIEIWQAVSVLGSVFLLISYTLQVFKFIGDHSKPWYIMNIIGCVLIGFSLWFGTFNYGSFILQVFFAIVSVLGLYKYRHGEVK